MMARKELWIQGGTVLTMDEKGTVVADALIHIVDGKVVSLKQRHESDALPARAEVIDATGAIVMPGLVNGHTHLGMTLYRGMKDDLPLDRWLNEAIFPVERKFLSNEVVHTASLLGCAELIRAGVVAFADMYYFEEETARAAHEAGLRCVAGSTLVAAVTTEGPTEQFFERCDRFRESVASYPRVVPALAPHSIYGISEADWVKTIRYAEQHSLPVLFHLSETAAEVEDSTKMRGLSPVAFFEKIGLFDLPHVSAAHAVYLSDADIEILGTRQVGVVHNPESNLKLGNAIARVAELRAAGAPVGFGTDSVASNNNLDVLSEAALAAKVQTLRYGVGKQRAVDYVRMLTSEGARAVGLQKVTGEIVVGAEADIIVVDCDKPHATPVYEPYAHLIYSAHSSDVRDVIIGGDVVMRNRELKSIDESMLKNQARKIGGRIAEFLGMSAF